MVCLPESTLNTAALVILAQMLALFVGGLILLARLLGARR